MYAFDYQRPADTASASAAARAGSDPRFLAGGQSLVPVSYTHLRAHETVLDIVWRLLLEKKKTKQQTNKTSIELVVLILL